MASIDALVVPSSHEGLPGVVLEAMAARKPVVATRAGGIPEAVVDGETGYLFERDDSNQLLKYLVQLSKSGELRRKMGEAGRKRAERHYDQTRQVQQVLDVLVDMLDRQGRRWGH
jgi:glycosyltransferase involved in cell wall biosynthesis